MVSFGRDAKKNSNTAGTQIVVGIGLAEDGTILYDTKNIEDIEVGDLVYSYDTATGEYSYNEVTDTFVRRSDHINYLTIQNEYGNEQTIETTDGHPFWVVSDEPDLSRAASSYSDGIYHGELGVTENGYWVEAKDLRVGDVFLGADGRLSTLTNAVRIEQSGGINVFNFTVEGNHNYFVLAKDFCYGQSCVLVHNAVYDDLINDSHTSLVKAAKRKNAAIYQRPGGMHEATADFNSLKPTNIQTRPGGIVTGELSDGTKINLHPSSSTAGNPVTLEIQETPNCIKIRYQ